jgi:hypothetical protein
LTLFTALVLLSGLEPYPSENWYTLLQEHWEWSATASFMVSGGYEAVLLDGMPLVPFGEAPVPPAGSGTHAGISDPLSGGLWSRGGWSLSSVSPAISESLLESGFTLLQNTEERGRYSIYLRRRLPGAVLGSAAASRGDSAGVSMIRLERNPLGVRGLFWNRGYSLQGGYSQGGGRVFGGFSRLSPGDRRPSVIGEFITYSERVSGGVGAGAAWSDPDLHWRGTAMASLALNHFILSLHGDLSDSAHVVWGGIGLPGAFSAGFTLPDSGSVGGFVHGSYGPLGFAARFKDRNRAALSIGGASGFLRGMGAACWDFDRDSLSVTTWLLPGMDWYRARIEAGLRVSAGMDSGEDWTGSFDALAGFTLRTFNFALALEDFTSNLTRSWTFGVTWSFSDNPPLRKEDEDRQR